MQADLADPHASFNVIVHEMAHKLDALDGAPDGTPPLPRDAQCAWAPDFKLAPGNTGSNCTGDNAHNRLSNPPNKLR